ncbi:TPA: hypothetical protein N0F65_008131 [Lagenidium giganteum]|uniref:Uncharacterized protein n=1 Tax=Lagenidium giganteum TaxID=4803 RepID=A0AAV2Z0M2_9STRA|nr:TPA: hypothetical protein N0F65_008131 [Lagenidium giganteum]
MHAVSGWILLRSMIRWIEAFLCEY